MAASKNYSQLKILAEELYCEKGYKLNQISEELGVHANTLTKWKDEGHWDHTKNYLQNAPHRISMKLNKLMEQILDGKDEEGKDLAPDFIDSLKYKADAISKIKPALALLEKDINPSVIFSVLTKLDYFMTQNYPDLVERRLNVHRAFLHEMIEQNG